MEYKIKIASGLVKRFMQLTKIRGIATLWKTIYILPDSKDDIKLIKHKKCHIDQLSSDGVIIFTLLYVYWLFRFGYYDNPYEAEARETELVT